MGRKFTLVTDPRPLEHIYAPSSQIPSTVSARICRLAISLMAFDYKIHYKPVKTEIPHADAMSRLQFSIDEDDSEVCCYNDVGFVENNPINSDKLRSEVNCDTFASEIAKRIQTGNCSQCSEAEKHFKRIKSLPYYT